MECHARLVCDETHHPFLFFFIHFCYNGMCLYAVKFVEEPAVVYNEPCHCLTNIEEAKEEKKYLYKYLLHYLESN